MKEVLCPACGALFEAATREEVVRAARRHTLVAHDYELPEEHILAAMQDIGEDGDDPEPGPAG